MPPIDVYFESMEGVVDVEEAKENHENRRLICPPLSGIGDRSYDPRIPARNAANDIPLLGDFF